MTSPETGPAPSEAGPPVPDASPLAAAAPPAAAPPPHSPPRSPAAPLPRRPARRHGAARSRRGEPRTYDFRRPTKLSREHVRVLQIAQEAFARQATTILTTFLRAGARLELVGIEQFSYDDYLATLPNPVFISTFTLEPLAGKGLLAYPLDIAMAIVDHMLGGSGTAEQPNRPMTAMETTITNHLLSRLLDEFAASFAHDHRDPAGAATASSTTRSWPRPPPGRTRSWSPTFSMAVGTREGEATLVLPFSSFAQALNNAASPQLSESALRQAPARRRGADRPAQPRAGRRERPVRAADGLVGRPALPRRR